MNATENAILVVSGVASLKNEMDSGYVVSGSETLYAGHSPFDRTGAKRQSQLNPHLKHVSNGVMRVSAGQIQSEEELIIRNRTE